MTAIVRNRVPTQKTAHCLVRASAAFAVCGGLLLALGGCATMVAASREARGAGAESTAGTVKNGIGPGMNADGEVLDAGAVEPGYGRVVTGIGGWEGEITGKPSRNGSFSRLQIGMPVNDVLAIAGQPNDEKSFETMKVHIPFYFGRDRVRHVFVYPGQGRLVLSGRGTGALNLVWIIHSAYEKGLQ